MASLTTATLRLPRQQSLCRALHAVFRHHAEHEIFRIRRKPADQFRRVRVVEDVERLLFEDDLRGTHHIARQRARSVIGNGNGTCQEPFGNNSRAGTSRQAMRWKSVEFRIAFRMRVAAGNQQRAATATAAVDQALDIGNDFSAPGTYSFPPGSMKSACASTSQKIFFGGAIVQSLGTSDVHFTAERRTRRRTFSSSALSRLL